MAIRLAGDASAPCLWLLMKYRKKPVVIDAVPYAPGLEDGWLVEGVFYHRGPPGRAYADDRCDLCAYSCPPGGKPAIKTLEGAMVISDGDMIVTGVKGERYPCKPDIFALTYEPVEEANAVTYSEPPALIGTRHR